MDKYAILQQFNFYRDSPGPLQTAIADASKPASLPAGAHFLHEGDPSPHFAMVGAGDIRVFKTAANGREITLYHVEAGQICLANMVGVILGIPAMATAVVDVAADMLLIPAARVREWISVSGEVRNYFFETMARRLMDVMALVEEVAFWRVDQRLADLLVRRFNAAGPACPVIAATHEEIAAELGTAREVVSRLLRDFERLGAISTGRGRIEPRDPGVLRDRAKGA